VLSIKWKKGTKRPEKSNAIDLLVSGQLPKDGPEREAFEAVFEEVPAAFTDAEKQEWLGKLTDVAVSSDAFVSCSRSFFFPATFDLMC
jgi:phosphoribosylaminoimidazolecarboxamide formyltransferase/IMP cyclohydrolase